MGEDNRGRVHAGSPLMEGQREEAHSWAHADGVDESSKSAWYLFLLTVSIGGYVSSVLFCLCDELFSSCGLTPY
jgi:hypothetical protein